MAFQKYLFQVLSFIIAHFRYRNSGLCEHSERCKNNSTAAAFQNKKVSRLVYLYILKGWYVQVQSTLCHRRLPRNSNTKVSIITCIECCLLLQEKYTDFESSPNIFLRLSLIHTHTSYKLLWKLKWAYLQVEINFKLHSLSVCTFHRTSWPLREVAWSLIAVRWLNKLYIYSSLASILTLRICIACFVYWTEKKYDTNLHSCHPNQDIVLKSAKRRRIKTWKFDNGSE